MIKERNYRGWLGFQKFLREYASHQKSHRDLLLFRGHADATWPLETTLDRHRKFAIDDVRDQYYAALIQEFEREAIRSPGEAENLPSQGDALDLLARHHGLPSPILDWSASPYVASFFAFAGAPPGATDAAVWVLDRSRLDPVSSRVEIIDSPTLLRYNPRALRQQGVFLASGVSCNP